MDKYQEIMKELIKQDPQTKDEFLELKKKLSGQHNLAPVTNATLIKAYSQIGIKKDLKLNNFLMKRRTRTLSGVTPLTVLTMPYDCPGNCIYCPLEPGMPKSYLSNEPAAQRAKLNNFDPAKQVIMRIKALKANGHEVDKIELLILGGSFNAYPKKYQKQFIKSCFDTCNEKGSENLEEAFKLNESVEHRIIGITIETRPDLINEEEIKWFRDLGVTRIQMGVQHLDNEILEFVKRGHTEKEVIKATYLLKQTGFKIDYHLMPDLPTSTPRKDLKMFKEIFKNEAYKPDQIKIYPTVISEYAPLYKLYQEGKHEPYSEKQLLKLLLKIKLLIPSYVRVNRLIRDIPKESIIAGNSITNLRQYLQKELIRKNKKCKCIRCREARENVKNIKIAKLFEEKYRASQGTEYFISYESKNKDKIYSFIRFRINDTKDNFIPELQNAILIRELHTYGQLVTVDSKKSNIQHIGFGKRLIKIAEEKTKKLDYNKIAIISGIGVRPYYEKLGYSLEGTYMVKYLN